MSFSILQHYKQKGLIKKNEVSVVEEEPVQTKKSLKEKELEILINALKEAQGIIDIVIPQLDSACSKYVTMLNELLEKKKQRDEQPKHYQEPQQKKSKGSRKQNLKKMYNKIAANCHPDKTEDPEMHKKFLEAKKAMDSQDEYAVFEIYKEFDNQVRMEEFLNLDQQILEKTIELSKLQGSNSYKISVIFMQGKEKDAKRIYLQSIMEHIQKLEAEEWE